MLRGLGFQDIRQRKVHVPVSPWSPDEKYREVGALNLRSELAVAAPVSHVALREGLGWPQTEVDVLVNAMKRDLQNTALQGYTSMYVRCPIIFIIATRGNLEECSLLS